MGSKGVGSGVWLRWRMYQGSRESKLRLLLLVSTAGVALVVFTLLAYGILQQYWFTPNRAVATVGDHSISLRTLQQHTRFRRLQLLNEYVTYSEMLQYLGEQRDQLQVRLEQIDEELNQPAVLSRQVLEQLVVSELVSVEAAARGITVTEDEIEIAVNQYFGYEDVLESDVSSSIVLDTELPSTSELTSVPTPTAYTEAAYRENYTRHLGTLRAETGMNEEDFRGMLEQGLMSTKLREAMESEYRIVQEEQVHARHILLPVRDLAIAQSVLTRALAGDDFPALASEFSMDATNSARGGDLGWFPRGQMVATFDKAVFSSEIGVIPELVATQFGLHVIDIIAKEVRPLPEYMLVQRRRQAFTDWISTSRAQESIEILEWWEDFAPAEPTLQDFYARLQSE